MRFNVFFIVSTNNPAHIIDIYYKNYDKIIKEEINMNRKLLITLGMCCFLTACSMGTNKSEQSENVSSTQSINSIESSNITSQSEISKEPEKGSCIVSIKMIPTNSNNENVTE